MRGAGEHSLGNVLLAPCHTLYASAAAVLRLICIDALTLDITESGKSKHTIFIGDKVLYIDLAADIYDFGSSVIAEFVADCRQFVLYNREHLFIGGEYLIEIVNFD